MHEINKPAVAGLKMVYSFLNIFFFVFHTLFTLFNMVGWAFPKTRKLHLVTMGVTAFSWFVLGIWYGWGYCPCTDWHWQIREAMGFHDRSNSYIHFLLLKLTGIKIDPGLVDKGTLVIFGICFLLSIWLNIRDRKKQIQGQ